jgi:hypothetical protein
MEIPNEAFTVFLGSLSIVPLLKKIKKETGKRNSGTID